MRYILSLDQGTTSCRAILFNENGHIHDISQIEFNQIYPHSGWVEHDPIEIWNVQLKVMKEIVEQNNINISDIKAIGITNQRETTVVWDKNTGEPIYNAIVWQCRRTTDICKDLIERGLKETIHKKTGLIIDAYFSGTKIKWILDNVEGAREKANAGDLIFGTIDTWLMWNLTKGKVHATDYTNASRTMLFNINTLEWDEDLLKLLHVPQTMLPQVKPSSHIFGEIDSSILGQPIPIASVAGDQHAALFGQLCLNKGNIKATYGTGCFMLVNTGDKPVYSNKGLLTTVAWGLDGKVTYALEGSIFMAGAIIGWLRDNLGMINNAYETEEIALSVDDSNGMYIVPAFQGLGTPYWNMDVKAAFLGMTRKTERSHIVRAALESIAYRVKDVVKAMEDDLCECCNSIKVDGGAARNSFLMQFQSNMLGIPVIRPVNVETTALGVAFMAGLAVGVWEDAKQLRSIWEIDDIFNSKIDELERKKLYSGWIDAVDTIIGE